MPPKQLQVYSRYRDAKRSFLYAGDVTKSQPVVVDSAHLLVGTPASRPTLVARWAACYHFGF